MRLKVDVDFLPGLPLLIAAFSKTALIQDNMSGC